MHPFSSLTLERFDLNKAMNSSRLPGFTRTDAITWIIVFPPFAVEDSEDGSGFKTFNKVKYQGGASGTTAGILNIFRGLDRLPQLKGSRDLALGEVLKSLIVMYALHSAYK